jgi:hypothetical protein
MSGPRFTPRVIIVIIAGLQRQQQPSYPEFINATTYMQKPVENEELVQILDRIGIYA